MQLDKDMMRVIKGGKGPAKAIFRDPEFSGGFMILCGVIVMAVLMLCVIGESEGAEPFTDEQAVRCIIGEAAGEGFEGMVAVAEALRNRGTLDGVYGCKAKFVDNEPEWVWIKAYEAWRYSKTSNFVYEATHWESTDFPEPYWAKDMKITAKIGKHIFYKEIK